MPQNNQTLLEKTVADQWQTLPSGLTVLVRPMPGYSSTHVIYATKFGSIDRDFCLNGQTVHLPAGVAHFLEHKMFEDEDGDAFAKYAKTGANANAFTSFDRTCYLFTATQQLDESLDVLLGMVGHPYFTEQTIAKEQGIIVKWGISQGDFAIGTAAGIFKSFVSIILIVIANQIAKRNGEEQLF